VTTPDTLQSLKGMHDALPPEAGRLRALTEVYRRHFEVAGYQQIDTPLLEDLRVFLRVGEGTDVVTKEMYAFTDRDGTEVALRPETTAGVARAFVQHHPQTPWKVWYTSAHFRHENTQRGRYRQHHQFGVECLGSADPDVDVEVIVGLWDTFTTGLGLSRLRLLVNSIGEPASRAAFAQRLGAFLEERRDRLDAEDRDRVATHPIRVLDSKRPATIAALAGHPTLLDVMSPEERARFERVQDGLAAAGVAFEVEPRLVRGLDYYTHTVFEIVSDAIDAGQSTIGAGGRYDGLVESMGGDPTPGVGFGSGLERVLLACDAEGVFPAVPAELAAFVVTFGGDGSDARDLCRDLRRAGVAVDRAEGGRSPKAQMKVAGRSGAPIALLLGDDERAAGTVTVRDLRGDAPQRTISRADLIDELRASPPP
jgi:histidyl-tRNA synthetase